MWGKLYRNGHFEAHFGPKNLRFSGLSWGFKSLLLHHILLGNQEERCRTGFAGTPKERETLLCRLATGVNAPPFRIK